MDKFECIQCGFSCKHVVKVNDNDIERLSKVVKIKDFIQPDDFDPKTGKFSLTQKDNGECIFLYLKDGKYWCKVYEHRPLICRKYPFFENGTMPCKVLDKRFVYQPVD